MPFNPELDTSQPDLNASQRRQVEQLVRRAGKTCEVCGSDDLSIGTIQYSRPARSQVDRYQEDGLVERYFCRVGSLS